MKEVDKKIESFKNKFSFSEYQSPFTGLLKFEKMLEMNGMGYFIEKINFEDSKIRKIRMVKSDGDSFYRSFMFALLEYHIIKNNLMELNEILSDIGNLLDKDFLKNNIVIRFIVINKNAVQAVLKKIYDLLLTKRKTEAYQVFIMAYFIDDNFDIVITILKL